MCKIHFGALWGVFGTLLGALMAFDTLLARRLTSEPSTTPGYLPEVVDGGVVRRVVIDAARCPLDCRRGLAPIARISGAAKPSCPGFRQQHLIHHIGHFD